MRSIPWSYPHNPDGRAMRTCSSCCDLLEH
nr:MAG TPA: hypothetical protein [Caudoviricetes sp.]